MDKFAVLIPHFGGIDPEFLACVQGLEGRSGGTPFLRVFACPYIDHARASLATRALEDTDAEVFFWLDHDIIFDPKDVEPMVDRLIASDYDMTGAVYSMRASKASMIGVPGKGITEGTFFEEGIIDALALGMGFTAVKRTTFERLTLSLPKPFCGTVRGHIWPFFHHIMDGETYLGEDYSFCRRVTDEGMKIGIDMLPRIFHKGSYKYGIEDIGHEVDRYDRWPVKFEREDQTDALNPQPEASPQAAE